MLQLLAQGSIGPDDLVAGASCLHPQCLEASLARSLKVMNIKMVRAPTGGGGAIRLLVVAFLGNSTCAIHAAHVLVPLKCPT